MFTIKQAADRAGLSPDVLRAWEKRYRIVQPHRSESGYRLYGEDDLQRLKAMRSLVEGGWKPREAASHLLGSGGPAGQPAPAAEDGSAPSGMAGRLECLEQRFVAAAARLDTAALTELLDEMGGVGRFELACEAYLFPCLRSLGDAWAMGEVSVAGEHAASAAVQRWLGRRYDAAARDIEPASVLVGLPPGARHELGALAFAVALRRAGATTVYLGADLPATAWVEAAGVSGARVAVVGVVMKKDVSPAAAVAAALRAAAPGIELAFGGRAAPALSQHGSVLPEGLEAATDCVVRRLA